jgi:hypothetical protein
MVVNGRIETRTEHFLAYVSNAMDVLDRNIADTQFNAWLACLRRK